MEPENESLVVSRKQSLLTNITAWIATRLFGIVVEWNRLIEIFDAVCE